MQHEDAQQKQNITVSASSSPQAHHFSPLQLTDLGFPLHAVLVEQKGQLLQEDYLPPYQKEQLHRMFSVTKSFCSLAIGALAASGKLSLDDQIIKYFPEYTKEPVHPWLATMTIRDMLRMQTCHAATTYKIDMTSNWVESFFTTAPDHRPGQIFQYDTSSSHTLAALVKKISGEGVLDFLRNLGLRQLGFSSDAYILTDPFGSEMGGSGLMARPTDLLCTIRLVMHLVNDSFFSEETAASWGYGALITDIHDLSFWKRYACYLREACSWQTPTLHSGQTLDEQQGYGYQFWMLRDGGAAMYGMGGQYAIMYPDRNLIYVLTADTQNIKGGTQFLLNGVNKHMHTLCPGASSDGETAKTEAPAPCLTPRRGDVLRNTLTQNASLSGSYSLEANASGFTALQLAPEELILHQLWGAIEYEYHFPFGYESPKQGKTDKYQQTIYTTAAPQADGSLYLNIQILDAYVGSIHMLLRTSEDRITVYMRKIEETYFGEFKGFFEGLRETKRSIPV